jgi:hypothetical protein
MVRTQKAIRMVVEGAVNLMPVKIVHWVSALSVKN